MLALILSVFCGCRHSVDSHLSAADSLMEEHPDSALAILEGYSLPEDATDYDRALYGMLLTQARYKNFIDETDDSLINASAEYFLERGDKEKTARSLFLKGMIEMNAKKLGEAAVAFSQGLDVAKEGELYMWQGQCARGLYRLYFNLCDASSQIKFAKQAYEAFLQSGDKGWIVYSGINLAGAFNNNCQYVKSLSILDEIAKDVEISRDSTMFSELLRLRGLVLFGVCKYKQSIEAYDRAFAVNPHILTEYDIDNIKMALNEVLKDTCIKIELSHELKYKIKGSVDDTFTTNSYISDYKQAYENLKQYKNSQDSILDILFRNNVSEALGSYEFRKKSLNEERTRTERLYYWIAILVFVFICTVVYLTSREKILKEQAQRIKVEADMESLRNDLYSQLISSKNSSHNPSESSEAKIGCNFVGLIRRRYAKANALCDDYYQNRYSKNKNEELIAEINDIVKDFTQKSSLNNIADYIDDNSDGLYSSFVNEFHDLTEDNRRLFLYLMLGFSSRTISIILGLDISAIYNKKSRLKAKIVKSDSPSKNKYLEFF